MNKLIVIPTLLLLLSCSKKDSPVTPTATPSLSMNAVNDFVVSLKDTALERRELAAIKFITDNHLPPIAGLFPAKAARKADLSASYTEEQEGEFTTPQWPAIRLGVVEYDIQTQQYSRDATWVMAENAFNLWEIVSDERISAMKASTGISSYYLTQAHHYSSHLDGFIFTIISYNETSHDLSVSPTAITATTRGTIGNPIYQNNYTFSCLMLASLCF